MSRCCYDLACAFPELLTDFAASTFYALLSARDAQNQVLGEVQFVTKTKVEKTSGVSIDGQDVGYVGELKDDKKVLLLPGEHEISVRESRVHGFY
jgi:hypothetical protein